MSQFALASGHNKTRLQPRPGSNHRSRSPAACRVEAQTRMTVLRELHPALTDGCAGVLLAAVVAKAGALGMITQASK